MSQIAIIYFSAAGTTAQLANAVHAGAGEVATAQLHRIEGDAIVSGRFQNEAVLAAADAADAIAFGSPTYMGGPAAQFKAFADATSERWSAQRWRNKLAAGFTIGAAANGDQGHTLAYFTILAAQHSMLWCGLDLGAGLDPAGRNRLGNQLGLVAQAVNGVVMDVDLATARHLGARLAHLATVSRR